MQHAYKSFLLKNDVPVYVQGNESLYALHNTSEYTVTLQGSNTSTEWVDIVSVASNTFTHIQSAFKFLKADGDLYVNRATAGSHSSIGLVDANGDQFNKNNPIPTFAASRSFDAKIWDAPIITKSAVSAKYSAILIWNPADSGINMSAISLTAWVSSSNRVRAVRMVTDPNTLPAVWTEQTGVFANTKVVPGVDARVCPFKVYTAALDAIDPATWYNVDVTSTVATGSNIIGSSKLFTPGTGVIVICSTANITLNSYAQMIEEAL